MRGLHMPAMRIIVLGNGAAGAEKQALTLGSRLRRQLQRAGAAVHDEIDGSDSSSLVRMPLHDSNFYQRLPPALQFAGARMWRDPFFGYAATEEQRRMLVGEEREGKRIIIGCGRSTVAMCAALRQSWSHADDVFNIQIQHPRVALDLFDAVIIPRHDLDETAKLPPNVYPTFGTVCMVDKDALKEQGERWSQRFEQYIAGSNARIAWLIGGPCRGFAFSEGDAEEMTSQVLRLIEHHRPNASLFVTFSRRTPSIVQRIITNRLQESLSSDRELFIWDGHGKNPYDAMLHHVTAIITTPDSISMTTEAVATGKPVYTVCSNRITGKFQRFHKTLLAQGLTSSISENTTLMPCATQPSPGALAVEAELEQIAARLADRILSE